MKNNSKKIIKKNLPIKLIALCTLIFSSIIFGAESNAGPFGQQSSQPYSPQAQFGVGSNTGPSSMQPYPQPQHGPSNNGSPSAQQFSFSPLQASFNPLVAQQQLSTEQLLQQQLGSNSQQLQQVLSTIGQIGNAINQIKNDINSNQQNLKQVGGQQEVLGKKQNELEKKLGELQKANIQPEESINVNVNGMQDSISALLQDAVNNKNYFAKWAAFYKTSVITGLSAAAAYFIVGELNKRAKVKRNESKKYDAKKVTGIVAATTFLLVSAYHYLTWQSVTSDEIVSSFSD